VEFQLSHRYDRPAAADELWPYEELREIRAALLGQIAIRIHRKNGSEVAGVLEGIDMHEPGSVALFVGGEVTGVPLEDVAGFTLLAGHPSDRADETG